MPNRCLHGEEQMEETPMSRYTNPLPSCCPHQTGPCRIRQEEIDHILIALACQNQILTDLLGAVNSLTAALLYHKNNREAGL